MSDEYKKGYREGFDDGFKSAERLLSRGVMPGPAQPFSGDYCGCQVCGMSWKDGPMGYVCSRSDCPTRVTCRTEVTTNRTLG
jgi:hypothetical protein